MQATRVVLLTVILALLGGCALPASQDASLDLLLEQLPTATFAHGYMVDPYIAAARQLQALGRKAASKHYVHYCLKNCDWSPTRFTPKTLPQKRDALEKLLASSSFRSHPEARDVLRSEIE